MIHPNNDVSCDICGLVMPMTRDLNVTVDSHKGTQAAYYKTHLNVCDKCLPNLLVMLELAMIKTSQLMVAENGDLIQ